MAEWGVTDKGFRRKSYQGIIREMEAKAQDLFGPNIDLSSASPLALFLRVIAFGLSLIWMVAERVYYSGYVDTATGQSLDYAVKYAGIARRPASPARRMLVFTGDPGVTIPQGFLVETEQGIRFATMEVRTIDETGRAEVLAEAVEPGINGNVAPGQITRITNPMPGVSGVTNIDHPRNMDGLNRETDHELRTRYYLSLARGGASTLDSILASVLEVPGVRTARVFHNPTMEVDEEGRPPKSVEVVTLGGADEDIAYAIHRTIAAGIQPYGTVEVPVRDAGGQEQIVRFSRAEVVPIYVRVQVVKNTLYPLDGDDQVRNAVIRYIGGTDTQGQPHNGLGLGADVIWTAVIEAARSVPGVHDLDVTIGTAPDPTGRANIPISDRQVAEATPATVVVTSG